MAVADVRYAVVTGGNKGIGFAICKQLASEGIGVVLTARDEKRGLEAAKKLQDSGFTDHVIFHQLDVTDPASVAALADFIKVKLGKLDILVNNAGGFGTNSAPNVLKVAKDEEVTNKWAKEVLGDAENLTEEKVVEVLNQYLKDYKEGLLREKNWPQLFSAYIISKAAVNAYTRILASKYPSFCINSLCPGYIKTDLNHNSGVLTPEEGAACAVRLALLPNGSPSGFFFVMMEETPF